MPALIMGSIGTLVETSELQRQAFNRAFTEFDLDWYWNVATYCNLLKQVGGRSRIRNYAMTPLPDETIDAIHKRKTEHFHDLMGGGIPLRPGVLDVIRAAQSDGWAIGFATTTSKQNVDAVFDALQGQLSRGDFDAVLCEDDVSEPKPDSQVYQVMLDQLSQAAEDCIVIEDTPMNLAAATQLGVRGVLFAGEYAEAGQGGSRRELTVDLLAGH